MISKDKFHDVKEKFGKFASWGVYAERGIRAKDNVGDMAVLDPDQNNNLLNILNPNIILVGLNISGEIKTPLGNFHSPDSWSQDYKIRDAIENTAYWGCYMTDIIKDFEQKLSGKVMQSLKKHPEIAKDSIEIFFKELEVLQVENPKIIAFGGATYSICKKLLPDFDVYKVSHYSAYLKNGRLREEFENI